MAEAGPMAQTGAFGWRDTARRDLPETGVFRPAPRRLPPIGLGTLASAAAVDRFVVQVMSLDLLSTVILQRIYLGVSITLLTHILAVALLLVRARARISPVRVILYWLFWGLAVALQLLSGNSFSSASIALGMVCYLPFLSVVPASPETYHEVLRNFQKIAMGVSLLVFMDLLLQIAGLGMPSMDAVVPSSLTPPTMNYIQPIVWGAGIDKPNAFFMLEASYASQFIATGLVIELALFRRWLWLAIFALAVLGTFSGTALMLILLTLPVLARKFWRQMLLYGMVALPLLAGIAVASGWYEIAANRATTFDKRNTSANQRFVGPFVAMVDLVTSGDEDAILFGRGAGKTAVQEFVPGLEVLEYNAVSKLMMEYGVLVAAAFLLFVSTCMFSGGVPFVIAFAVAMEYHFMGGYFSIPPILNYSFILAAGWALRPPGRLPMSRERPVLAPAAF